MAETPQQKIINDYNNRLNRLSKEVAAASKVVNHHSEYDDEDSFFAMLDKFCLIEKLAEEFVLETRISYRRLGIPHRDCNKIVNEIILDNYPCRIGFTPRNWFFLEIPPIPAKKHKYANKLYVRESLSAVMSSYFNVNDNRKLYDTKVYIVFINVYDESSKPVMYDNDNKEYTEIINIITSFLLVDDSPEYTNLMASSVYGDRTCTRILIIPEDDIVDYMSIMKSEVLDTIVSDVPYFKNSQKT